MSSLFQSTESATVPSSTSLPIALPSFLVSASSSDTATWFYTAAAVLGGLLILEQSVYRWKKRHLPGDNWTIPIIGKFADSMKPTMEGYQKQWESGALSALSVFNMYVPAPFYLGLRGRAEELTTICGSL